MPRHKICGCGHLFVNGSAKKHIEDMHFETGCREHINYLHKEKEKLLKLLRQFRDMETRMIGVPRPYIKKVNRALYGAPGAD